MNEIKCIMFDCMETLIDMTQLPRRIDYALWAFEGSGCEEYFKNFDEFYFYYKNSIKTISYRMPKYREYDFEYQYNFIARKKGISPDKQENIVKMLFENYWENYKKRCFVNSTIKETLDYLRKIYTLGVVSNFKVKGGIDCLLEYTGIRNYFGFVVNSAEGGWRKPHPYIYLDAIRKSGFSSNQILFIGDDFENDYLGPEHMGINSIFYDKKKNAPKECRARAIYEFIELKKIL